MKASSQVRPRGASTVLPGPWIESLVADEARRTLAFDLDQSIQALRAARADPAEIMRLSGIYAILLRMWVKT